VGKDEGRRRSSPSPLYSGERAGVRGRSRKNREGAKTAAKEKLILFLLRVFAPSRFSGDLPFIPRLQGRR
jgi:hypothetical protein